MLYNMSKNNHPLNKNNLNPKALVESHKRTEKKRFLRHIYNSRKWKELRNEYITEHPNCEICGKIAQQVHHKRRFSTGKNKKDMLKLAYDRNNLMSLCKHCHISKHQSTH